MGEVPRNASRRSRIQLHVKLAEDVGRVKKPAGIRKRVTFIGVVDECDFKEVSVVSAL